MNVNELMIGDWLFINHKSNRLTPRNGKVSAILNETDINTTDGVIDISLLEPIPLTHEILEKNGFVKKTLTDEGTNESYTAYQWNPTPQFPNDGIWLYPDDVHGYEYSYDIRIKYVHQLQHLFRLTYVNNEIIIE